MEPEPRGTHERDSQLTWSRDEQKTSDGSPHRWWITQAPGSKKQENTPQQQYQEAGLSEACSYMPVRTRNTKSRDIWAYAHYAVAYNVEQT
jgi:hypothetical protein